MVRVPAARCCGRPRGCPRTARRGSRAPTRPGRPPTRCRRAPCSRCRRRPGVLAVVDPHRPRVDVRLERRVVVGEIRHGERHLGAPWVGFGVSRAIMLRRVPFPPRGARMPNFEEIKSPRAEARLLELDGISRASVEAHYKLYQGYVAKRNEILGKLESVDLGRRTRCTRTSGPSRSTCPSRSAGSRTTRSTSSTSAARAGPERAGRAADRAGLRLGRRVARRPEGDRDGRPRLGVDGVRLGRAPALQLRRRRSEHVPGVERHAARGARRLRARVLPRLPDRPWRVHRRVLRQPRLGRRQRLGAKYAIPLR